MLRRLKSSIFTRKRYLSTIPSFANVDPWSGMSPHRVQSLLQGKWLNQPKGIKKIFPDPLTGAPLLEVTEIDENEIEPFIKSLNSCPKTGLHNPLKSPERYIEYGNISAKAAAKMRKPEVMAFFTKLIQRVAPKSEKQAYGEVAVTQKFIENFSGDQVRFLARGFSVPGDHAGQMSTGHRWPYGPVVIIAPFNFPLEIPLLQLMGALYMGNKVLLKVTTIATAIVT